MCVSVYVHAGGRGTSHLVIVEHALALALGRVDPPLADDGLELQPLWSALRVGGRGGA